MKKKKRATSKSNDTVDVERGRTDYNKLSSSPDNDDDYAEPEIFDVDQLVWCGDFGEELQSGKVVISGQQKKKVGKRPEHRQVPRKDRPRVRPDRWVPTDGIEGYVWDTVFKKENKMDTVFKGTNELWNGARHRNFAIMIILCILAWGALALGENVFRLADIVVDPNVSLTAFDLAKLGNDTISVVLCLLVFLLWSTVCFKFVFLRRIWSWKPRILKQSMMPGGFIPRPAAVSLGVLMFVTSVFISEREVGGASLYTMNDDGTYTSSIGHGESCRADVREESHYQDDWFSRMDRLAPVGCYFGLCQEGSPDPGCQQANRSSLPLVFTSPLNASGMPFPNIRSPFLRGSHITLTIWHQVQGFFPSLFGRATLDESTSIDEHHTCIYQCVKWKAYGFNTLVAKLGTIGAGNAIVTKLTETATGFLGKARVTPETNPEALGELLRITKPDKRNFLYKRLHKSAAVPALIFGSLRLFLAFFVYKIDDHGFFTVDYYVSQVLLFAICTSAICRCYNVFRWEHLVYSNNMWTEGSEDFVIPDGVDGDALGSKPKTVDLFVWLHMSFEERAYLLIMYARKLPEDDKKWKYAKVECFIEHTSPVSFYGTDKVKKSHNLRIKRGLLDDAWPQGHAIGKVGGMALVKWDDEHTCVNKYEEEGHHPGWLHDLKNSFKNCRDPTGSGLCKDKDIVKDTLCADCERYKAATTTKISPMYLFDTEEKKEDCGWTALLKEFIGDSDCQDQVRGKILRRLRKDLQDQSKPQPKVEDEASRKAKDKMRKRAQKAKDAQETHYRKHLSSQAQS